MILLISYAVIIFFLFAVSIYLPALSLTSAFFMFGLDQLGIVSHSFFQRYGFITNVIVGSIVFIAYLRMLPQKSPVRYKKNTALILTVALITWSMMSILWSPQSSFAYNKWMMQLPYWIVLVGIVPQIIRSEEMLHKNFKLILFVAIPFLVVFDFLIQWGFRSLVIGSGVGSDNLGLPLALSELGGYLFIIAVLLMSEKSMLWKLIRAVVALLACILIIKTGSRGQLLLAIGTSIIMLPFTVKELSVSRTIGITLVGGLVLGVAIILFESISEGGANRWNADVLQSVYGSRLDMAFSLVGKAASNPMSLLIGLGNSAAFDPKILGFYPHIVPLEILAEEGLVGFSLLVTLVVYVVVMVKKTIKITDSQYSKNLVAVVLGLAIFQFGLSFKQGSLLGSQWLFAFPIILERLHSIIMTRRIIANRSRNK